VTVVLMVGWHRYDDWTVYFTGPTDSSNECSFL